MAEIKKGILGGFSGKVGTVVGANWRGKDIIRSLPKSNNKAPTDLQLLQRYKFKKAVKFLQPIRILLNEYFGNKTGVHSRYNLAVSYTISNALDVVDDLAVIVMERILVSKGDLVGFLRPTLVPSAVVSFELQWEDNSGQGNAKDTDIVNVVCYCEELDIFEVYHSIESRGGSSANIQLPTNFNGKKVNFWAFLNNQLKGMSSTSIYLGEHTVE